ncbi:uncharacterized protein [Arachis hypogaea]|uniref:uncharacterized protein n=1 Tax=Arachis hypogaea TaxID=3818 RepID=UPI003B218242
MADVPPPSLSELMRMVAELQQANQRIADENQIMAAQIAELNHVRTEHNDVHRQQPEDDEHHSPSHVSETIRADVIHPEDEKEGPDDLVGPFTEEVMNFELPKRFTLPLTLTPYDGLGDPKKFLKKFRSIMIVNGASDTILCRCFLNYLDGPALDWLCALPAGSVSRFQQLAKLFEENFTGSAIYLHDSDYLNTIKQGQNESLKDYMTHFTKIAISIPDLYPEVHLHALKSSLRPGKFQETIAIAKPKTLAEFREKAKGQIDIEEIRQARKSDRTTYRDDDKTPTSKKSFKLTPRFDSYTQFNTKREDIIKEILHSKLIKPPRKAGTYQDTKNADKSKYCAFHQKHGYTTDDCVIAKDLLERLARQGHLDKTEDSSEQQYRGKEKVSANNYEKPRGIINYISGGYASGGSSNSARKRSFRSICSLEGPQNETQNPTQLPQLTFTQADYNSSIQNLDDPVVITLQLGDLLVKKVLLDPGSSADVLFYSTFQKMKLSNNILQSTGGDLVGFSGERVPIRGTIMSSQSMEIIRKLSTVTTSQKKRKLGKEKRKASLEETQKLISADFIKEIRFTTWLANMVMVRKQNGKWRMCVDFTDLNKACPKDSYPLPSIDSLVDNASGYATLSFMDAYSGYNQILMHPSDQCKTAFITDFGNYCYKVMPFGLKNARTTYQRLMDKVFTKQIGRNIEVYVDDMVAKTKVGNNHLDELTEIFAQISHYNMHLNSEKCAFCVQGGKFLGFLLTNRGIEANPDKCRAVLEMTSPKTIKEVQRLTGRLAALSRFVPCLASKSNPFFQTIKKKNKFQWTDDCERAFNTLKTTLSQPPILQKPLQGEDLFLYLSVTNWAIRSALVTERSKIQQPVYFVSKTLHNAELNYPRIEKLALALVFSAQRL